MRDPRKGVRASRIPHLSPPQVVPRADYDAGLGTRPCSMPRFARTSNVASIGNVPRRAGSSTPRGRMRSDGSGHRRGATPATVSDHRFHPGPASSAVRQTRPTAGSGLPRCHHPPAGGRSGGRIGVDLALQLPCVRRRGVWSASGLVLADGSAGDDHAVNLGGAFVDP